MVSRIKIGGYLVVGCDGQEKEPPNLHIAGISEGRRFAGCRGLTTSVSEVG